MNSISCHFGVDQQWSELFGHMDGTLQMRDGSQSLRTFSDLRNFSFRA